MLKVVLSGLDGRSREVRELEQLEYSDRFDTPAQSLLVRIPSIRPAGELTRIRALYGSLCFFDGAVDEQEWTADATGEHLEISARSTAAALLDNEAIPVSYNCPSLEELYRLYLKPYGIRGYVGSGERCSAWYSIQAGISEWEVVRNFCVGVLGVLPRINGEMILDASGLPGPHTVLFDNQAPGAYRYTALTARSVRSGVIGEIAYRSERDGAYSYRAVNRSAQERGITARQVISLADTADWEKNSVIGRRFSASEQGSRELVVQSPQFVPCGPGDRADVRGDFPGSSGQYVVYERDYRLSGGAVVSRVILRPEEQIRGWRENVADTAVYVGDTGTGQ